MGEDPRSRVEALWERARAAQRQAQHRQEPRRWAALRGAMPGANALTVALTAWVLRERGLW